MVSSAPPRQLLTGAAIASPPRQVVVANQGVAVEPPGVSEQLPRLAARDTVSRKRKVADCGGVGVHNGAVVPVPAVPHAASRRPLVVVRKSGASMVVGTSAPTPASGGALPVHMVGMVPDVYLPPPRPQRRAVVHRGLGPVLLAKFRVACAIRVLRICPSLISQIDGLCFSLSRMRLERDVLAHNLDVSFCPHFGHASFESASSYDGLYFGAPDVVAQEIVRVSEQHGRGVFIVVDEGPACRSEVIQLLFKKPRLTFTLPSDSIVGAPPISPTSRIVAVLVDFGMFRWKAKRRRENKLSLDVQPRLAKVRRIGTQPELTTRVSPIAHERYPKPCDDEKTSFGEPAAQVSTVDYHRPPQWDPVVMGKWAKDFPCPGVSGFALDATSCGIDSFVGDISKAVWQPVARREPEVAAKISSTLAKEISLGRCVGPLPHPPFKCCRTCPNFGRPKKKHDPTNNEIRMCCHFSKGGKQSVNALCINPHLISVHCSAASIPLVKM